MQLKIGDKAPNFNLPDSNGIFHKLADFRGKKLLVYFYPRDDTPGCTKEACVLRDTFADFKNLNTAIVGISADSIKSHNKFSGKYKLPFLLLSDPDKTTIKAYGAWGQKKFMGRAYDGIFRISFLIEEKGKIIKIYDKVKPPVHAKEVLKDLNNT